MWLGLFQPLLHDRALAEGSRPLGIVLWTSTTPSQRFYGRSAKIKELKKPVALFPDRAKPSNAFTRSTYSRNGLVGPKTKRICELISP